MEIRCSVETTIFGLLIDPLLTSLKFSSISFVSSPISKMIPSSEFGSGLTFATWHRDSEFDGEDEEEDGTGDVPPAGV
jgi:hypothetical protein